MKTYELMLVLRPDFDITDEKKVADLMHKLLPKSATVDEVEILGKKSLSYPIAKHSEGGYVLAKVSSERLHAADVQKQTKMGDAVIRFLLTAMEEK
jgi:small subunit ribosomal protein S6